MPENPKPPSNDPRFPVPPPNDPRLIEMSRQAADRASAFLNTLRNSTKAFISGAEVKLQEKMTELAAGLDVENLQTAFDYKAGVRILIEFYTDSPPRADLRPLFEVFAKHAMDTNIAILRNPTVRKAMQKMGDADRSSDITEFVLILTDAFKMILNASDRITARHSHGGHESDENI